MTNRQAAVLASWVFSIWFIYRAVLNLGAIPTFVAALMQGPLMPSLLNNASVGARFERTLAIEALTGLFDLCVNVAVAIFFYRCSPGLIRFLTDGGVNGQAEGEGFS